MGDQRQLRAMDGFTLGAYEALPNGDIRGAVVVIQEIFGVNAHIREVTDGIASAGYAAIAPQIFDRAKRDVELGYKGDDMAKGAGIAFNECKREQTLMDLQAAVEEIGKHGKVGVVGYCYGGLMTWLSACKLSGLACAVVYYGGGIVNELDQAANCPVMMHFGAKDAHIPVRDVEKIKQNLTDARVFVYPADHGFNCNHRGSYDEDSASRAHQRTLEFFEEHLTG